MQVVVRQRGEVPSFRELAADPIISEESRLELAKHRNDSLIDDFEGVFNNLNKYRQLRGLYNTVEVIDKAFNSDSIDTDRLLDDVTTRITDIRSTGISRDLFTNFGNGNNATPLMREMLDQTEENFIPTGIKAYDDCNGGFFYGSLVTMGATSGGGKSAVSLNINMNMSMYAQEDTVFIPLEMSKAECSARMMARLSGVPHLKILLKKLTEEEIRRVKRAYKKFIRMLEETETRFTIFKPQSDMTIEEILMTLKPHGYKVITTDYISLLKGVDGDDAWQKLGGVARYAKIFAENNNCVNILLCQVSEDGAIRYARSISEHSSSSWIWTPKSDELEGKTKIILDVRQAKGRNQSRFPFSMGIDLETMRMFEVDNPYEMKVKEAEKNNGKGNAKYKNKQSVGDQKSRIQINEEGVKITDAEHEDFVESLKI